MPFCATGAVTELLDGAFDAVRYVTPENEDDSVVEPVGASFDLDDNDDEHAEGEQTVRSALPTQLLHGGCLSGMMVELVVGYMTNSMALVADSFHMLSDVIALAIALHGSVSGKEVP